MSEIYKALRDVQQELKAPKNEKGRFGAHRSAEGILAAVKPVCAKYGLTLVLTDEMVEVGPRNYVRATATVIDDQGDTLSASSHAWEGNIDRGLDASQVTGVATSYARKYALGGLFAIDDTKDADSASYGEQPAEPATAKQKQVIMNKLSELGVPADEMKAVLKKDYNIDGEMTKAQASTVLDSLIGGKS